MQWHLFSGSSVSSTIEGESIGYVCRTLLAIPFFFTYASQVASSPPLLTQMMLTSISLYRLYLVVRSVQGHAPPSRSAKTKVEPPTTPAR